MRYNVKTSLLLAAGILIASLVYLIYSIIKRMSTGDAILLVCFSAAVFFIDLALCKKGDNFKE